ECHNAKYTFKTDPENDMQYELLVYDLESFEFHCFEEKRVTSALVDADENLHRGFDERIERRIFVLDLDLAIETIFHIAKDVEDVGSRSNVFAFD
ncbi:hypothetical protein KI387_022120, partial [Taxus chinensis]